MYVKKHRGRLIVLFSQHRSTPHRPFGTWLLLCWSVQAGYWRFLSGKKLPLSLAIMLNRLTAATVRTGNWPARIEMPPEACNQATGQLWGSWGVYFQTTRDYMFTLSFSFLVSHSHFHSCMMGEHFFSFLFFHSVFEIQKQHFDVNKRVIFSARSSFPLIISAEFFSAQSNCVWFRVGHEGNLANPDVAQLLLIVFCR